MPIFHQTHNSIGNHTYNVFFYSNVDYNLHFHKNYEIIYVVYGNILCTVNGKSKVLTEGDFAFCLSNEIHSIKAQGKSRVWVGVFSEDFIHEFGKFQKGKTGEGFSFRCPEPLMSYLKENLIQTTLSNVFQIKACLYALCDEYLKQNKLVEEKDKQSLLMNDIVDYIETNYNKNISLDTVAEKLGYEYCYFSKLFNRLFSMSFNDNINTYRFNTASEMLITTDASITEIAYESGFQSIRSFNNTFKKLSGLSPSEYRKSGIKYQMSNNK